MGKPLDVRLDDPEARQAKAREREQKKRARKKANKAAKKSGSAPAMPTGVKKDKLKAKGGGNSNNNNSNKATSAGGKKKSKAANTKGADMMGSLTMEQMMQMMQMAFAKG